MEKQNSRGHNITAGSTKNDDEEIHEDQIQKRFRSSAHGRAMQEERCRSVCHAMTMVDSGQLVRGAVATAATSAWKAMELSAEQSKHEEKAQRS